MITKNIFFYSIFLWVLVFLPVAVFAQEGQNTIGIIPQPLNVKSLSGSFSISNATVIKADINNKEQLFIAQTLADYMAKFANCKVSVKELDKISGKNEIVLKLDPDIKSGEESYQLEVKTSGVTLKSASAHGLFYAMESLTQLLPLDNKTGNVKISARLINDKPKYPHRGMLLDVGRTFYPVEFVKKFIDFLAFHKMNTFHWHLTEDQGWRIEIKKYPLLTQVGAWRDGTLVGKLDSLPHIFDNKRTGGFYTQEQIRDVVSYAKQRYIEVIPEIEMPGHAQAALAAYPNLSCSGGPFEVSQLWGVRNDIYCAGNEQTITFLEDVLSEVCDLFPSPNIHIGGDECPKIRWKNCVKCQARIKAEGLKDEEELQSYLVNRIAVFLQKKNKKVIGWDEILTPGVTPDATIMSWRGIKGGIAAAKAHHNVIMAPESMVYLDYYQGDPSLEPVAIGGLTTLQKVYSFDPTPKELNQAEASYIRGAEGTLWTEYIRTPEYAEYMLMPRLAALAEIMWTTPQNKNWEYFKEKLEQQYKRYEHLNINYSKSALDVERVTGVDTSKNAPVTLFTNSYKPEIYYTTDGTMPAITAKKYTGPIEVHAPYVLKAANFKNGVLISKIIVFQQN